jgi:hypothetical protein
MRRKEIGKTTDKIIDKTYATLFTVFTGAFLVTVFP